MAWRSVMPDRMCGTPYPFTVKWMLPVLVGNSDPLDNVMVTPPDMPVVELTMLCACDWVLPAMALANAANCDEPQFHAAVPVAVQVTDALVPV